MKCREFFPLCPFFRVRARDGKERKVANKAPRSRPPNGATSARAPRRSRSPRRAPRPLPPRLAARPQRRLSLSLKPEAAEHDRARGRQAEGKDEQRPFVRSNTTALHTGAPLARRARRLCLWHGSALIRCGSLLTNCSGTILPACTE